MSKCKIIREISYYELEESINKFIEDKIVTNVSISINRLGDFYACIIYDEWSEY